MRPSHVGMPYFTNEILKISSTNEANTSAVWPIGYMVQVIVTG